MPITAADRQHYKDHGYVVVRSLLDDDDLDALELTFTHYAEKEHVAVKMHSPLYAKQLADLPREAQARLYDAVRASMNLEIFAEIVSKEASDLLLRTVSIKAPRFRMDQPHDTRFVAHWHQDHAYVGGSIETVTAWVPLQDVDWPMGPLVIAPGTQRDGPLPHDTVLSSGRKCAFPHTTDDLAILPMRRGDVLFFHSLLLHSGQVNFSDRVRYSIQVRYEPQ